MDRQPLIADMPVVDTSHVPELEEMTEDDFTVEIPDLKLGRLYEHFQAMQNKVNALERTAKHAIDTLEARVVELEAQSGGE